MVTALTTNRPPGRSARTAASSTLLAPPPMNIASGCASPANAAGATPSMTSSPGTPNAAALRRMREARSLRASIAMARSEGSASIHSIATEPAPAPTSQSSSPRRGESAASVIARISRLLICPSCSKSASGSPGARASTRAPGEASTSMATALSGPTSPRSKPAAVVARTRSRGPPSASSTVKRELPKPTSLSSRARAAGPSPSEVSASTRAPGCRCGRMRSSERACSESWVVSGSAQPSRAAARLKVEGAGTATVSRGSIWRNRTEPTP